MKLETCAGFDTGDNFFSLEIRIRQGTIQYEQWDP
jgi:hypothetical protein